QIRDGARFAKQAFAFIVARCAVTPQHLDRDESVKGALACEVNGAECADAERSNNLIVVVELSFDGVAIVDIHPERSQILVSSATRWSAAGCTAATLMR